MIQNLQQSVARVARLLLITISVLWAGDSAWAVCSPGLGTYSYVQHNLTSSYCVLCGVGEIRIRISNPRDNGDDLSALVVTEDLRSSGLTYVPGSTTFVGYNVAAPAAFNPVVSGSNGSMLTWTFPVGFTLDGTNSSNDEELEIRFQVRRHSSLTEEGLVSANRNIETQFTFTPSCDATTRYTDNDVDELPIRQPVPYVTKQGRNTDAGQASNRYSDPVYGNINDDVIWRIRVQNRGLAALQDLRIDDVMGTGNFVINYVCPNEASATTITNTINNGVRPAGSPCRVVAPGNSLLDFAVDDPFGNPSNDEPGAYVDVPANNNSAYIYFVGKITSSCTGTRTNTVSDVQWGCEVNSPDGGIAVPATTGGSTPTYRTTDSAVLSTVATMSGLTVTQAVTGTNTSQPVGSKGTVTLTIRNQTGGTVKNINFTDTLPVEYVMDPTFTPTVSMAPAYANSYMGMTNTITWTNPAANTFPLTTTDPALPLSNTAPRFSLTSSTVNPNYPDQFNLMRHGDVLTVTYRIVLIKPQNYDKVANLDVREEAPTSDPPGTDPVNNTPSLTNRIDLDYEQFCNPGIIQRPAQMVQSNIPVSPEDLDIDIVGSELIFILTNDPAQPLPLSVALTNRGGHDARDYHAFVTFGATMQVQTAPAGCVAITPSGSPLQPAPWKVWVLPAAIPASSTVYHCTSPTTISPGQTVTLDFTVIKTSDAARLALDDLSFRADVAGEITLSNSTPLWFPTPTVRADGQLDRANNYSLDGIRARVIGFNLLKSRLGNCTENNPPPSPDLQVQIGEECRFHIETGGWFGFQTPGFSYIAVQDIRVDDQLPNGQGYIWSSDPYVTGTSSPEIQGITLYPVTLAPLDEGTIYWTFNVQPTYPRIVERDKWFLVDMDSRLLNDPINTVAAPNQHAALSTNTLVSTFQAVFMNDIVSPAVEEIFNLGPSTVGYPRIEVRRVSLTVTEPHLLVVKEVCNENLYGIGTVCSNWVTATAEGDAEDNYIYRVRITNEASSSGVARAPAYDVTTTDLLDPSDFALVYDFMSDGLDNDGDGQIDGADTDGEGSISDNTVKNTIPATIGFSHTHSVPLLRIDPGQTVSLYYRVNFDDDAAPRQIFVNNVNATYDSLTGLTGSQTVVPRPNGDIGGAREYTSATATATVEIIPVLTEPKRITRVSNGTASGSPQPVTIGEEFEYELVTSIPVAQLNNFIIRDELPAGVRCAEAPVINLSAAPYTAAGFVPGGSFTPTCTDTYVEWNFGDQSVTTGGAGGRYDFAIRFIARLENSAITNNGGLISNGGTATAVTARYNENFAPFNLVVLNFDEAVIAVREPVITLTKAFSQANADAADELTVTVTATNPNTGSATAYNLRVLDDLTGTKLTYLGSLGGSDPPISVDTTTLGANRPIFSWNPGSAIAPGTTRSFTFVVRVDSTVQPLETLDNTIQADWTSLPGQTTALNSTGLIGANGSDTGMRNGDVLTAGVDPVNDYEITAPASFSVPAVTMSKTVLPPAVTPAIGAHHNFQIEIRLPEGESRNVIATDNLIATGVSYVLANNTDFDVTYTFDGIASINGLPPDEAAFTAFPADNTSGTAVWNIGTVITTSENDLATSAVSPVIRINYYARANNDLLTDAGHTLRNSVTVNYSHGETGATQALVATTSAVTVLEPLLTLTKTVTAAGVGPSPGDTLQYRVTITNNGGATASTAYDINIVDALPAGVVLDLSVAPTASIGGVAVPGFVSTPLDAPAGPLTWGRENADNSLDLPAGQSLVLDYQVTVQVVVDPTGLIGNSVRADWTSLDGDSTYERNGDGCPNITAPDDYCVGPVTATIIGVPINLQFEKSVTNRTNPSLGANAIPGDVLRYRVDIRNMSSNPVANFSLVDELDRLNTIAARFVPGTLTLITTLPAGAVNQSNPNGGTAGTGLIDIRNLSLDAFGGANANLTIEFDIQLVAVIDSNSVALNQAQIVMFGLVQQISDDTTVPGAENPTTTTLLSAPAFQVRKTSQDLTGDSAILLPGDTLRYTITVKNIGTENAYNVSLRDLIPANTTYVANSTTLNGAAVADSPAGVSVLQGNYLIHSPDDATAGIMPANSSASYTGNVATITFDVTINASVINGTVISNQGFVNGSGAISGPFAEKPSDDPATAAVDDPTRNIVGNLPLLYTHKTVQILVDNGASGIVDPGDVLRYTFTITNTGAVAATGVALADSLPTHTSYVAGSFRLNGLTIAGAFPPTSGVAISSSDLTPPLPASGAGILSAGGTAVATFDALVLGSASVGDTISNQATLSSNELLPQLSDADGTPANGYQPTVLVVGNAQQLAITKQVSVVGGGAAIVGAQLEYIVSVRNISAVSVSNVIITDTLPTSAQYVLSYVAGSARLNSATTGVTEAGTPVTDITANYFGSYGNLLPGATAELRFRVQIDSGTIGATITNTGTVTWDSPSQSASASAAVDIGGVPGSIVLNGTVWHDADFANDLDASELLLAGWEVRVLRYLSPGGSRTLLGTVLTDSNGVYQISGLTPTAGTSWRYELLFRAPGAGANTASLGEAYSPLALGFSEGPQKIYEIDASSGAYLLDLNLPIDPDGVIYDAALRTPVAGSVVTLMDASGEVPATCFDDPAQYNQVTLASGYYKFDLNTTTCPTSGDYQIRVVPPAAAYATPPSSQLPPASSATTPAYSVPLCSADAVALPSPYDYCEAATSEFAPPASVTAPVYYLNLTLGNVMPKESQLFNNHIPVDPKLSAALTVSKVALLTNVTRGQMVPYTITIRNSLSGSLSGLTAIDTMPPGFKYVEGSARINDVKSEPLLIGRQLHWQNLALTGSTTTTLKLLLIVGAGVSEGEYVNRAQVVVSSAATNSSAEATATVRVVPDPVFDCTDVIGKVFDDTNANGYQDKGEKGLEGVRVVSARGLIATTDKYGRYHLTCAVVPNEQRGSNYILKLDDRSLPGGYRLTTENPLVKRATRGKMIKFNFGATLHRVVRLDISDAVFEPGTTVMRPQWEDRIDLLLGELKKSPSILRLSYLADVEDPAVAQQRLDSVKRDVTELWKQANCCYALTIETELYWRRGSPTPPGQVSP